MDFDLRNPDDIRKAIAVLQSLGAVGLPTIFRDGVLANRCAFAGIAKRESPFPSSKMAEFTGPSIVLIGDDDDAATGPLKWRSATQAGRWANAVMVHGAGAEEHHYHAAIAAAELVGRVLVIETSSRHVDDWAAFLRHPRTLLVKVSNGLQHPKPRNRSDLH